MSHFGRKLALFIKIQQVVMENVVVDTGFATSVFFADKLFNVGLKFEPSHTLN